MNLIEKLRALTEEQLVEAGLPPGVALRVIDYLATRDQISKPADLLAVRGIGPKRLAKLIAHVTAWDCGA